MKKIPLTQNKFALVDDEDFETVSKFKWYAAKRGLRLFYAVRTDRQRKVYMHREILGLRPGGVWDGHHFDGCGLNNQRSNLARATTSQNIAGHRDKSAEASSRFRGVGWDGSRKKWRAQTKFGGKSLFLGRFQSEVEAAEAYDAAVRSLFGRFSSPNFPLV